MIACSITKKGTHFRKRNNGYHVERSIKRGSCHSISNTEEGLVVYRCVVIVLPRRQLLRRWASVLIACMQKLLRKFKRMGRRQSSSTASKNSRQALAHLESLLSVFQSSQKLDYASTVKHIYDALNIELEELENEVDQCTDQSTCLEQLLLPKRIPMAPFALDHHRRDR